MENELENVIDEDRAPADLTITYDDMHGLWGGSAITVRGDGAVELRTRQSGAGDAEVTRKRIGGRELIDFVRLLVELRAWEQHTPASQPVAGESRAHLIIRLEGKTSSMWERFNEMRANDRLIRIKARMENL